MKPYLIYRLLYRLTNENNVLSASDLIAELDELGIDAECAKEKGRKLGRPALIYPENWKEVYTSWKAGEITAKTAMEMTATKRTSFYKLVGMTEENA